MDGNSKKKPGPKEETLKADGVKWEDAVAHALNKRKPKGGFPKKCDHPSLASEVMFGQKTGDYVCSACGETFSPAEAKEIRDSRK